MVHLKRSDIKLIESFVAYPRGMGYVVDLSNRTFAEFFEDEFKLDIYGNKYAPAESSKRHHLIGFCEAEHPVLVAKVLRRLRELRLDFIKQQNAAEPDNLDEKFLALIRAIESGSEAPPPTRWTDTSLKGHWTN